MKTKTKPAAKLNAAANATPGIMERMLTHMNRAQAELYAELGILDDSPIVVPSWKRVLTACIAGIAMAFGVGWLAGHLLTWLSVGAFLFTASSFLFYAIWALGLIAAMYYGGRFAARVTGAVLTGEVDARAASAYASTRAFFTAINPFSRELIKVAQ